MSPLFGRFLEKLLFAGLVFFSSSAHAAETPLPFFDSRDLTPYWSTDKDASTHKPIVLSKFHVIDQDGKAVNEQDLKTQVTLVNFFFAACPGICPMMMQTLKSFQKTLGTTPIRIYSFSVTPQDDSPQRLKTYAENQGLSTKHWSLLTGDEKEIFKIGKDDLKADGATGSQKNEDSFIHTTNVYLIDRDLHLRGIYDTANPEAMKPLAKDIARLKAAAQADSRHPRVASKKEVSTE